VHNVAFVQQDAESVGSGPLRADLSHADVIDFLRSLPNESIDLIATDPAYSGMNRHLTLGKGRIVGVYGDRGNGGKWFSEFEDTEENYHLFLSECARVLKRDRHIFIMFDSYSLLTLGQHVRSFFDVKNVVVWDKVNIGMGHYFRRQSEFILFASKGKRPLARRDIPDIWSLKRLHRAPYPTQKPVELFEAMIAASVAGHERITVCDPFAGSGSAAIAALRQGCDFVGCDRSEDAVEAATGRIDWFLETGEDLMQPHRVAPSRMKAWW
jgi:site-specific DNA-methyltransferase (adenine-specific)